MALAPLPASNTIRYFYDYTVLGDQHSMLCRVTDAVSLSDVQIAIDDFLQALSGNLVEITTVGLRVAAEGSDITNPVATGIIAANYGSGAGDVINAPLQVNFVGRSPDGRKSRVGIFGWTAQTDASWRITSSEDSDVLAAITSLTSAGAGGIFVSISGARPLWKPYADIGYNDHWVKQARKGG